MFFFKRPSIVLDCFTADASAFEYAKPNHAIKFIPNWWKNVPASRVVEGNFFESPTIKRCSGLIENYKHGFMIPLWSDLNIELGPIGSPNYRWQYSNKESELHTHSFGQMNNYLRETDVFHGKLINPWYFKCTEETMWSWVDPTWNRINTNDFVTLPGILDYKYQHNAHINMMFFRGPETKIVRLNFGSPLVQVIPLSDQKLKMKHHLVSEREIKILKDKAKNITFVNKFLAIKKLLRGSK